MVVQQSLRSVENAAGASDACEQHGIRVQKPMITDAGARPAMSRTIANASSLRFIFDGDTSSIRSSETDAADKRFRQVDIDSDRKLCPTKTPPPSQRLRVALS